MNKLREVSHHFFRHADALVLVHMNIFEIGIGFEFVIATQIATSNCIYNENKRKLY